LIDAGPARLASRSMIPYQVLIFLLTRTGTLRETREFLDKRFNTPDRLERFHKQLGHMIANLAAFGFLARTETENAERIELHEKVYELIDFRSVDPLYAAFLTQELVRASFEEKLQALESVLPLPPVLRRKTALPETMELGPLQVDSLQPRLLQMGLLIVDGDGRVVRPSVEEYEDYWEEDRPKPTPTVAEMLSILFESKLATPENVPVVPKWVAGGILEHEGDFFKYTRQRDLSKNEGLILRHLLRLVILAGEFQARSGDDPDYGEIIERVTRICAHVDRRYTDHFLAEQEQVRALARV
jgi:hypothetical protein